MPQDYTPDLSLNVRSIPVDHVDKDASGIHTTVLTSSSTRTVERDALVTPFIPNLLPLEDTILRLEIKYRAPVIVRGKKVKDGLYGMALYIAIASEMAGDMHRPGRYPDMTFMKVRDILNSEFINVARQYYAAAENEIASIKS